MIVKIDINENVKSKKYQDISNDIFIGISRLRKKIKKKYKSNIKYEIR